MDEFDSEDHETAIEEYPGYVGHTWEGKFFPGPELELLSEFDWPAYSELLFEHDLTRHLNLSGLVPSLRCEIEPGADLAYLLDQIPSLRGAGDRLSPDAGIGASSGYVFFQADGISMDQLKTEITALRNALDEDLREISQFYMRSEYQK